MFVRADKFSWLNLDRDDVIQIYVEFDDAAGKHYVHIETDDNLFDTQGFDSEAEAIAQAQNIVDQLSAQEE